MYCTFHYADLHCDSYLVIAVIATQIDTPVYLVYYNFKYENRTALMVRDDMETSYALLDMYDWSPQSRVDSLQKRAAIRPVMLNTKAE